MQAQRLERMLHVYGLVAGDPRLRALFLADPEAPGERAAAGTARVPMLWTMARRLRHDAAQCRWSGPALQVLPPTESSGAETAGDGLLFYADDDTGKLFAAHLRQLLAQLLHAAEQHDARRADGGGETVARAARQVLRQVHEALAGARHSTTTTTTTAAAAAAADPAAASLSVGDVVRARHDADAHECLATVMDVDARQDRVLLLFHAHAPEHTRWMDAAACTAVEDEGEAPATATTITESPDAEEARRRQQQEREQQLREEEQRRARLQFRRQLIQRNAPDDLEDRLERGRVMLQHVPLAASGWGAAVPAPDAVMAAMRSNPYGHQFAAAAAHNIGLGGGLLALSNATQLRQLTGMWAVHPRAHCIEQVCARRVEADQVWYWCRLSASAGQPEESTRRLVVQERDGRRYVWLRRRTLLRVRPDLVAAFDRRHPEPPHVPEVEAARADGRTPWLRRVRDPCLVQLPLHDGLQLQIFASHLELRVPARDTRPYRPTLHLAGRVRPRAQLDEERTREDAAADTAKRYRAYRRRLQAV
ncbi:hypothetical protein CDCA_CDCA13G3711 [Cyanidium caldarium]|uniref:Uncharacterized protein n=1 Tax=Cyanidium caldarium TaxID=2771 RepID=A0AAV9J072_CYACA|nr:hypothetical protein CDCA_CDCA13G3711 [Cyanidium caldarium]